MAGFGFGNLIKPQPISVRAGDVPSFRDLSAQEKLLMLGATLRGDTQSAMQIPMLAAARRHQAAEQDWRAGLNLEGVPVRTQAQIANQDGEDITAAFAPQIDTVQGPRPTMRDLIPKLKEGIDRGYNVAPYMDLIEKTGPKSLVVNGRVLDERDPSVYGGYYGDAPTKGAEPVYDRNGREVGWRMSDGSLSAIEAVKRAEGRGEAAYSLEEIENSDGSKTKVPRLGVIEGY